MLAYFTVHFTQFVSALFKFLLNLSEPSNLSTFKKKYLKQSIGIHGRHRSKYQPLPFIYIIKHQPVAKGEHSHPTRTQTQVYRVPNMHSDHNAKEPGSMAWQSEHILMCSDDHIVTQPLPFRYISSSVKHFILFTTCFTDVTDMT